ncbi:MAG: hypothetical protein LBE22_10510 [Azoarcus sp.]|jgi:hypothetical protein|nr:hypothetical protein [Azoarcus sp.]
MTGYELVAAIAALPSNKKIGIAALLPSGIIFRLVVDKDQALREFVDIGNTETGFRNLDTSGSYEAISAWVE